MFWTILGGCWHYKVVSVFLFPHPKCHFLALENGHFCRKCPFSCAKKWHFGSRNKKTDTTFYCQLPPKMVFYVMTPKEVLKSKSWRKQTSFRIKFYIENHVRRVMIFILTISPSLIAQPCNRPRVQLCCYLDSILDKYICSHVLQHILSEDSFPDNLICQTFYFWEQNKDLVLLSET